MEMLKRIVPLGLAILLVFGASVSAAQPNIASEKQIEAKLLKMGYTKEQIELLNDGVKAEIAKEDDEGGKLSMFRHKTMTETTPEDQSDLSAQGSIDPATLYFNISVIEYPIENNTDRRKIYSDFRWDNEPYWKLKDKLGIAWSDSWNVKADSDALVYQYYGEMTGDLYSEYYYNGVPELETGVHFEEIDLKELVPDGSEHTKNHSGWGKIEMFRAYNQSSASLDYTDIMSKYYHNRVKLNTSASLTLFQKPDITISVTTDFDEISDLHNISYNP